MSHFIREGNSYRIFHNDSIDLHHKLPAGNYVVKFDEFRNQFFLEEVDAFEINTKLYGDVQNNASRILHTFADRPNATGVILSGEKGSGKTLLIKKIASDGAVSGYPTIIINSPFFGDIFNAFIQTIDQPAIILFDEFEKVYNKDGQQAILTLLDGVFPSKKLFLLTCNDKWQIDVHMRNRPGRIYYMLEFDGLELDFIREYCTDNLINKDNIENVCKVSAAFQPFNFDMLKALVEEMNRYGETAQDCVRMLNVKPEYSSEGSFDVEFFKNGTELNNRLDSDNTVWKGNPMTGTMYFGFYSDEEKQDYNEVRLTPNNITDINYKTMTYEYVMGDICIKLVKQKTQNIDKYFYAAF